jgi:predicted transcriptional regulator
MEKLLRLQQKIAPESFDLVERRYQILRMVCFFQPVGRRHVAEHLGLQERTVRNEAEFLKRQGFLVAGPMGMELTEEGKVSKVALVIDIRGGDFFDDFEFEAWSIVFFSDMDNTKYEYNLAEETPDGSDYSGRFFTNLPDNGIITWARPVYVKESFSKVRMEIMRTKGLGGRLAVHFRDSAGNTFQSQTNIELEELGDGWQTVSFSFAADDVFGWGGRSFSDIKWPLVRKGDR